MRGGLPRRTLEAWVVDPACVGPDAGILDEEARRLRPEIAANIAEFGERWVLPRGAETFDDRYGRAQVLREGCRCADAHARQPVPSNSRPGLIGGAADGDPSGLATYLQNGAQFGHSLLWAALFILPVQTAVQEAYARIGAVTGNAIAAVARDRYPRPVDYAAVALLVVANTVNLGADLGRRRTRRRSSSRSPS